jgi:YggT family protein
VQPKNSNAFLDLVIEISDKILMPLRQYIPSAGGLDFSPLFIFILIQFLSGFLNDLLRYVV